VKPKAKRVEAVRKLAEKIAAALFRVGSSFEASRLILSFPSDADKDFTRAGWSQECVVDEIEKHLKSARTKRRTKP